jgi:hypothetical protein
MKLSLAFTLIILLLSSCAPRAKSIGAFESKSIVGGQLVQDGSILSKQVALVRGSLICTGTFITRDIVLTAAHCFENGLRPGHFVAMGLIKEDLHFKTRILKLVVGAFDMAMLKVENPLPSYYSVTRLATAMPKGRVVSVATGFGREVFQKSRGPLGRLKFAALNKPLRYYSPELFSVEMSPEGGISFGDSGGPLFVLQNSEWVQIGVAHAIFGIKGENTFSQAAYLSVPGNIDWIRRAFQSLN